MTKPVILTGAGSFFGTYVLRALDAAGVETFALSRHATATCKRLRLSTRIKPVEVDLSASRLDWSPPSGCSHAIIHLAFDRMKSGNSAHGIEINNRITHNILDLCHRANIAVVVNASSTSVYGKPDSGLLSSETEPNQPSKYGAAKLRSEQLLANMPDIKSVLSIRLPALLGHGAHPENWLVRVARAMQQHSEIVYQSPDFKFNNAVHGASIGSFFAELSQEKTPAPRATFPVGAASGTILRDLLERMRNKLESNSALIINPAPSAPFAIDNTTAKKHGYRPEPIESVIDQYVDDLTSCRLYTR